MVLSSPRLVGRPETSYEKVSKPGHTEGALASLPWGHWVHCRRAESGSCAPFPAHLNKEGAEDADVKNLLLQGVVLRGHAGLIRYHLDKLRLVYGLSFPPPSLGPAAACRRSLPPRLYAQGAVSHPRALGGFYEADPVWARRGARTALGTSNPRSDARAGGLT